jgi:hypothetical protein
MGGLHALRNRWTWTVWLVSFVAGLVVVGNGRFKLFKLVAVICLDLKPLVTCTDERVLDMARALTGIRRATAGGDGSRFGAG